MYAELDFLGSKLDTREEKGENLGQKKRAENAKLAKIAKFKEKQTNFLGAHELEEEAKEGLECIVCREERNENLLCLGWLGESTLFSRKMGIARPFLFTKGCMHVAHLSCVKALLKCPLCKKPFNSFFPHQHIKYSPDTFE